MAASGAAQTFPIRAGEVKKGTHVLIKGFPCKVIEVTTSKTGKHGHAKANITALHIFEGSKHEDISPTSHNMEAPFVVTKNYTMIDINEEGFATLMADDGETREDLHLDRAKYPAHEKVMAKFDEDSECDVRVVGAMGREMIFPTSG